MKRGSATYKAIHHSLEGSKIWVEDQAHCQQHSKAKGIMWVPIEVDPQNVFKSDISELRPLGSESSWGLYAAVDPWSEIEQVSRDDYTARLWDISKACRYYEDIYMKVAKDGNKYPHPMRRNAKGAEDASFLMRETIDVSPHISRALQYGIEKDGLTKEVKDELEMLLPTIAEEYTKIFEGASVSAASWHVLSGQLHLDLWIHDLHQEEMEVGIKKKKKTRQARDYRKSCHYGGGSGVVAWDRHLSVLGKDAVKIAPGTLIETASAIDLKEKRGEKYGHKSVNRDIQIHRYLDKVVAKVVDKNCLVQAKQEYKSHLIDEYKAGLAGPRLDEDRLSRVEKLAEESLTKIANALDCKIPEIEQKAKEVKKKADLFDKMKRPFRRILAWISSKELPEGIQKIVDKFSNDPDLNGNDPDK